MRGEPLASGGAGDRAPSRPPADRARRALGWLIGAAALAYLFLARLDWRELASTLAACDWWLVPQILAAQVLFVALGGLALWLLAAGRHDIGPAAFLGAYWRCVAVGFWTPAASGEFSLAWLLRPHGVPLREGLALVTLDKLITALTFAILALPAGGWIAARMGGAFAGGEPPRLAWVAALAALSLVALLVVSQRARFRSRRSALTSRGRSYLLSLRRLATDSPARLAGNLALTLMRVLAGAAVLWWSIEAFSSLGAVSFPRFVVMASAARLLALVLPSPSGLGVYEVTLVELLSSAVVPAAAVVAGVLLSRVVGLLAIVLGLMVPAVRGVSGPAVAASVAQESDPARRP